MIFYRAADDDFVRVGTSFAETLEVAVAYRDNPGFGGARLWQVEVEPRRVLDLVDQDDPWQSLSEAAGREIRPEQYQYHFARVLATDDSVCESLAAAGYDWVRYPEDFPADSVAWTPVSEDAADAAYDATEEMK